MRHQQIKLAKIKAGVQKNVGVHSLRHSFASPVSYRGWIREQTYVIDLLGHFDIRTTERQLHLSKKQLVNIISPFGNLWNNEEVEW